MYCRYVNVFHGCTTTDLPKPQGIAACWHFIKAVTGNTVPAAVLPFGKYSCCMYTTAYPSGYADHYPNSCPQDLRFLESGARFHGLSHFHQSGTGAIDLYYNYAITVPFLSESVCKDGCAVLSEQGVPGYYSVISEPGIKSETTVSRSSAYHRFTFPSSGGKIAVDFTNNGLFKIHKSMYSRPSEGCVYIVSPQEVRAEAVLDGLRQYFAYRVSSATIKSLISNNTEIGGNRVDFGCTEDTYGVLIEADGLTALGRLSVSLKSMEDAVACLDADEGGFDKVKSAAYDTWNEALSRIEIHTDDEREKEIFYSNLYHTLVKPCDRSGECPLFEENDLVVDFSTMWDIYKTQLPLLFTVYPEIGEKILATICNFGEKLGRFPHTLGLCEGFTLPTKQACMLAESTVCDAFYRGIPADYERVFNAIQKDLHREDYAHLFTQKLPERLTHLLDMTQACGAVAELAQRLGKKELSEKLRKAHGRWRECFDESTGLLKKDFDYYEGNHWNYSFRLLKSMSERIELAGGAESFTKLLDRFFGYTFPESKDTRFEGFNNESDMEAPYAYIYAGRNDRTCEIIDAANRYMFTTGRGGLPGNNDSGALSSCYIWNAIGIFPVTGQDLMLIGTPRFERTVMHLPGGKNLAVQRIGEGIYTKRAVLNGREIDGFRFKASEMTDGGTLELYVD